MAKMGRVPGFCSVCGNVLGEETILNGYDPYTGESLYTAYLKCLDNHETWYLDMTNKDMFEWRKMYWRNATMEEYLTNLEQGNQ